MGRRRVKEALNRVCKVIPCPRPSRVQLLHLAWISPFVFRLLLLSWGDLGSTGCCCPPASCFSCPNPLGPPGWVRSSARPPACQQPSFFVTKSAANCSHACSGISAPFCRVTTAGRAQQCHLAAAKPCGVWSHRSATAKPQCHRDPSIWDPNSAPVLHLPTIIFLLDTLPARSSRVPLGWEA